uniref:Uncharacterized protein n=1 Tax=Amphora coffeiformis TaxID=265554 RepID=A0A7S3P4D3_9STRA|eukprot:scaffold2256_cov166-Amphora_coffeaeformis.AAC.25
MFHSQRQRQNAQLLYLLLVATATLGLVCTLLSAYSCKFASVSEIKTSTTHLIVDGTSSIPASFGIWKVRGRSQSVSEWLPDEYFESNDKCLPWKQSLWEQNGSIRASKTYAVLATIVGTFLWLFILRGIFQKVTGSILFALCSLSLLCEALAALFFEIMGAQTCYQYGMQCSWDMGAYYAAGAVLMWMSTAIGFALYQPRHYDVVEEASVDGADSTPNHASNNNNLNNQSTSTAVSPVPVNDTHNNEANEVETNPPTSANDDIEAPTSELPQDG